VIKTNAAPKREVDKFTRYAKTLVKHHFGAAARRIEFKASGLTNFVFAVKHKEGEFVLRISPDPTRLNLFIKEQWAQKAARDAGAPVPSILEVGAEVVPFPYMISETVSGTEATDHPRRLEILREMGSIAAKINSIKTTGFGQTFDWSENQLSLNDSFKTYLRDEFEYEQKIETLLKHKSIDKTRAARLRRIFADAEKVKAKPVLNHGDLRLKNVIASPDGKINAVIDWESAVSHYAPHWELSIALHDLGIDEAQHFLEGYGISEKKLAEAMPLIKAFNIANYAPHVEELAAAKDRRRLEQYRTRLSGVLDLYSL
jgi:aminoglycoside phosphotransferase (APT) family kinase protein